MTRCKFIKTYKLYRKGNDTCEKDGGLYYGSQPAGCWIALENLIPEKESFWKKVMP